MIVEILLTVLKVLLIILLSVIGLVLFIILLLCISPIRYKIDGKYYGKPDGTVTVSWLLHILHVNAGYNDEGLHYKVRVFGIPILKSKKKEEETNTAGNGADAPEGNGSADQNGSSGTEAKTDGQTGELTEKEKKEAEKEKKKAEKARKKAEKAEKKKQKAEEGAEEKEPFDIAEFFDKLDDSWYETEGKIVDKLNELDEKIQEIRKTLRLISNERTEAAIKHVMKYVFKILKSILPKKMRGAITFGLENPADTGTVLGVLAATMPLHKNHLKIEPVFTDKVFEGQAYLKGRIYIGFILLCGICIILNRNVLVTIKRFKKHFSKK